MNRSKSDLGNKSTDSIMAVHVDVDVDLDDIDSKDNEVE